MGAGDCYVALLGFGNIKSKRLIIIIGHNYLNTVHIKNNRKHQIIFVE
jgi:hypothetical protein